MAQSDNKLTCPQERHLRMIQAAGGSVVVRDRSIGPSASPWSRTCLTVLARRGLVQIERSRGAPKVTITDRGREELAAASAPAEAGAPAQWVVLGEPEVAIDSGVLAMSACYDGGVVQ